MNHLAIRAWLGMTLLCTPACSTPFGYSLQLRGGLDRPQEADHLYFHAERIEGLASDLNALVVPPVWRDRDTRDVQPGVLELTEPLELGWIVGRDKLPEATRVPVDGLVNPDRWVGDPEAWVRVQARPSELGLDAMPRTPELQYSEYDEVHERMADGQDAYVLVPHRRFLKHGFDVFAASGPPLTWVRIGRVRPASGEGPLAWTLGRTLGALAYGVDGTYLVSMYALATAMMPVGGLVVWSTPMSDAMVESPW